MKNAYKLGLAAASIILIGQGCAPLAPAADTTAPSAEVMEKKDDAMMEKKDEGAMEPKDDATMEDNDSAAGVIIDGEGTMMQDIGPSYTLYDSVRATEAMKAGQAVVLYFYAAWCPICRAEDPKIKSWIEGSGLGISGFRVNYDKESALKAKYKIPYQHTTVFLNAKGEEAERFSGPVTESEFRAALAKAAGK